MSGRGGDYDSEAMDLCAKYFSSSTARMTVSGDLVVSGAATGCGLITPSMPVLAAVIRDNSCSGMDGGVYGSILPSDQFTAYALRKVSRSALIVSAWVVGIPCGKPL